jgi:starch synthase
MATKSAVTKKAPGSGKKPLKVLFVGSEAYPYAQVGGLGEVLSALPKALRKLKHDVRVFIPKYGIIKKKKYKFTAVLEGLRLGKPATDPHGLTVSNVLKHKAANGAITYLLENMEYYEKRANVYGYSDDTVRWVLLSRGVLEFIRQSDWVPDVIVANDWQTGFIPNLMKTEYRADPVISRIASVFVAHNLKHQGSFDVHFLKDTEYDQGADPVPQYIDNRMPKLNGMRRGILYADTICTVSPTYATEILSTEFGEKLEEVLRHRQNRLTGILNGIDYKKYNPATDRHITKRYSANKLAGRAANKKALQRISKLPQRKDVFLLGFSGRLDDQKGIKLFMEIAEPLLKNLDMQFVLNGVGDNDVRMFFKKLKEKYPDQVHANHFTVFSFSKRIFAGADALLMPSRFEPAGLVQMEAMHYGSVPVVRNIGGLADTVKDDMPGDPGTGFLFDDFDHMALMIAIVRTYQAFHDKRRWEGIVRRGMRQDFTWDAAAKEHDAMYRRAIRLHRTRR